LPMEGMGTCHFKLDDRKGKGKTGEECLGEESTRCNALRVGGLGGKKSLPLLKV